MKSSLIIGMLLWISVASAQQIADSVYWVYFTDKIGNGYQIDQPEEFLSDRSVNRRGWQGLAIDHLDLPVTQDYVEELKAMGVEIKHISKWRTFIFWNRIRSIIRIIFNFKSVQFICN